MAKMSLYHYAFLNFVKTLGNIFKKALI